MDLREENRWLAFATTARLQPQTFRAGFQAVLNEAVAKTGLIPVDWEVDLVTSTSRVFSGCAKTPKSIC